jgi:hypothetical protein
MKNPNEVSLTNELERNTKRLTSLESDLESLSDSGKSNIAVANADLARDASELAGAHTLLLSTGAVFAASLASLVGFGGTCLALTTRKLRSYSSRYEKVRDAGVREHPFSPWNVVIEFIYFGILLAIASTFFLRDKLHWDLFSRAYAFVDQIDYFNPHGLLSYCVLLGFVFAGLALSRAVGAFDPLEINFGAGLVTSLIIACSLFIIIAFFGTFFAAKSLSKYLIIAPSIVLFLSTFVRGISYSKMRSARVISACKAASEETSVRLKESTADNEHKKAKLGSAIEAVRSEIKNAKADLAAEAERWSNLSRTEQLEEIRLYTEIEVRKEEKRQIEKAGHIAERKAKAEIDIASRRAEAQIKQSREEAEAETERRRIETQSVILANLKNSKKPEASKRICKYCGCDVDAGVSALSTKFRNFGTGRFTGGGLGHCETSPTGSHVLL